MTGEKNRYSSVEKLWKLDDDTLKTPTHDEMVLYLLNEENLKRMIHTINKFLSVEDRDIVTQIRNTNNRFFNHVERFWESIKDENTKISNKELFLLGRGLSREIYRIKLNDETIFSDNDKISDVISEFEEDTIPDKIREHIFETLGLNFETKVILKNDNIYYIYYNYDGNIWIEEINKREILNLWKDLVIGYNDGQKGRSGMATVKISSEVPIMTQRQFLVGYFDIVISLDYTSYSNEFFEFYFNDSKKFPKKLFIEVKPYINSFGATLRQLRTYQEYYPECKGRLILFTKDNRFKKAFESQGIPVLIQKEEIKNIKEKEQSEIELEVELEQNK